MSYMITLRQVNNLVIFSFFLFFKMKCCFVNGTHRTTLCCPESFTKIQQLLKELSRCRVQSICFTYRADYGNQISAFIATKILASITFPCQDLRLLSGEISFVYITSNSNRIQPIGTFSIGLYLADMTLQSETILQKLNEKPINVFP